MPTKARTSRLVLWSLYGAFMLFAIYTNIEETTFRFDGPLGGVKALVWSGLFGFLGYSVYCSSRENFFHSVKSIASLYWGRQVGIDLYLGLCIGLFIIFLNDGLLVALIWLVPVLIYANLVFLLYFALHFDDIVTKLLGL